MRKVYTSKALYVIDSTSLTLFVNSATAITDRSEESFTRDDI